MYLLVYFGHVILSVILWNILVLSNITLNAAPLKKKTKTCALYKEQGRSWIKL